ncbi:AAA family ATPase [Paenibacillus sp. LMG 31459]|uniref:AAA family ATPase n=1 Tax=Paenibacillus phytohabitans TaxID=2654978 RepID=A0ABX1YVP9_9BACL|nr:UvrD-helicase domain-containing protein [Paenibacillus phytohabitans]NOU84141.1 AAA family ATPase [Paenibacillus phytohabitans]
MASIGVVDQVYECIDNSESFIIEAGAGSGKTWTLVKALEYIIQKEEKRFQKQHRKVACITYTNVAKEEIISRINGNEIVEVKTIHDFLWKIIEPFQKELKQELLLYINSKIQKNLEILSKSKETTQKYKNARDENEKYQERIESLTKLKSRIQYKDNANYKKGIISHDVMLELSINIINNNKKLLKIIQDTYPVIFIDEYQDTKSAVAKLLIEHIKPSTSILFGLFGDYYQQIYNGTVGRVDANLHKFKPILKSENYRSSDVIISILNRIRTDDLEQIPSGTAKEGKSHFYYINNRELDTEKFIKERISLDFSLDASDNMKKLFLVTKAIAKKNGYIELHELYDEDDSATYKVGQIKSGFIGMLRSNKRDVSQISRIIFDMLPTEIQIAIDNGSLQNNDDEFIDAFNKYIVKNKKFNELEIFDDSIVQSFEKSQKSEIINRILLETYFPGLFSKYSLSRARRAKSKDMLLKNASNRDCIFANFLFDIEEVIELYQTDKVQQLLKKTAFELNNIQDKLRLNELLLELISLSDKGKISEVLDFVNENRILEYSNKLKDAFNNESMKDSFYEDLMELEYIQFRFLHNTVKDTSPFSTNHGTKGAEFNNVVCFIDDNDWNSYSLNKYLEGRPDIGAISTNTFDIQTRTRNLFYVICSRAKHNLAIVVMSEMSSKSIAEAKSLFGEGNFIDCFAGQQQLQSN